MIAFNQMVAYHVALEMVFVVFKKGDSKRSSREELPRKYQTLRRYARIFHLKL